MSTSFHAPMSMQAQHYSTPKTLTSRRTHQRTPSTAPVIPMVRVISELYVGPLYIILLGIIISELIRIITLSFHPNILLQSASMYTPSAFFPPPPRPLIWHSSPYNSSSPSLQKSGTFYTPELQFPSGSTPNPGTYLYEIVAFIISP